MKIKIGVISHYSKMEAAFKHLEEELDCELIFKVGVLHLAKDIALQLEQENKVDAIITNSNTCDILKNYVGIPVIPMHLTNNNLLVAFNNAKKYGNKIAFADIHKENPKYDIELVKNLLNYDIVHYTFENVDEAPSIVDRCILEGKDILVTPASCMKNYAKTTNLRTELLELQDIDIIDAIERAFSIIHNRNKELEKLKWLTTLLDNSTDGVIIIDNFNKVQLINEKASKLIGIDLIDLKNKKVNDLIEKYVFFEKVFKIDNEFEIFTEHSKEIVVSKKDIHMSSQFKGSLITISELNNIQNIELKARNKIREKGFYAKYTFDDIKGNSDLIWKLKDKCKKYSKTNSNIVVYGESGCGKELFAQSIHNYSNCSNGNFIAINCATLPEQLLESELFGYEEGAFSGAKKGGKQGLFELAHDGTLFLDEIGEMPIQLQSRLLRALQEKTIRRVGGNRNIFVNVRIIAATNRDLLEEVKKNNFREDLYYRLNVLSITIPPLRNRINDVSSIASSLIATINKANNTITNFSANQLEALKMYDWPGNVRELNNFVERILVISQNSPYVDDELFSEIFSELTLTSNNLSNNIDNNNNNITIPISSMKDMEINIIKNLLEHHNGDKKMVEKILGFSSTTFWRKTKDLF